MKWILLLVGSFISLLLTAQNSDCIEEVWAIEQKLMEWNYEAQSSTVFLHYQTQITDWEGNVEQDQIKIYRNRNKLHFFSSKADILQDEQYRFLLFKPKQLIFQTSAEGASATGGLPHLLKELRKELKTAGTVLQCSSSEKRIKTLMLEIPASLKSQISLERVRYRYDPIEKKIHSTTLYFDRNYQVQKMEIRYLALDFDSTYNISKAASKYVFDAHGKPRKPYQNFQFSDN